jgi:membrane protease YdiL (CAAX protease family)
MTARLRAIAGNHPLITYFVLAFAFTWIGSLVYYFTLSKGGQALPAFLGLPGAIVWYYGPALAAIIVTRAIDGTTGVRQLLRRLLTWRVGWGWYVFIVLYPLALHLTVVCIRWLLGGSEPRFFTSEGVPAGNPLLTLLGLVLVQILLRGLGEEPGWRGFALPKMLARWNALAASLLLGLIWALWHFHPANFAALLPIAIWFVLNVVATTVVYTWVFNNTGGSLLIAVLFHMTLNVAEWVAPIGLFEGDTTGLAIQVAVLWLVVAALVIGFGPQLRMKSRMEKLS